MQSRKLCWVKRHAYFINHDKSFKQNRCEGKVLNAETSSVLPCLSAFV